jgi:hypothetical protein
MRMEIDFFSIGLATATKIFDLVGGGAVRKYFKESLAHKRLFWSAEHTNDLGGNSEHGADGITFCRAINVLNFSWSEQ